MAADSYRAKIKNFTKCNAFLPFDPKSYSDHFLRKNYLLKINR